MTASKSKWPKLFPPLSTEQQFISDDFMKCWHQILPSRYGLVDRFGHRFAARNAPERLRRTLEIGAGLGEHISYEALSPEQEAGYYAMDIRKNMIARIREKFPGIQAFVGDIQKRLDFPDGHFDRILAIHVLEHLPDLPMAIREIYRLCNNQGGRLTVAIPCEGGLLYRLARKISAQRIFEKRYKQPYKWFIEREHLSCPEEILQEVAPYFEISNCHFFPLKVHLVSLNLVIGINLYPRPEPLAVGG